MPYWYGHGWDRLCHELTTYLARSALRAQGYHLLQCRKVHKARQGMGFFFRRDLVSPSSRANYTLTSPTLSTSFFASREKSPAYRWDVRPCRVRSPSMPGQSPAGKMETNKSPRSCQQVFSRPSNIFWPRGLNTNIWYPIRHCDSCLAHSNQRANLQKSK